MRSFRLAAFVRNSILGLLSLFVCLIAVSPAFALKLVSSTSMTLPNPNPSDSAYGVYRAGNGDVYATGSVGDKQTILKYDSNLVLISSAQIPAGVWGNIAVDQSGNIFMAGGNSGFQILRISPDLENVSSATVSLGSGSTDGLVSGPDGNLYVSGVAEETGGGPQKGFVVKISPSLSFISSATLDTAVAGGICDVDVSSMSAVYAVVGTTRAGIVLFKYDANLTALSSAAIDMEGEISDSWNNLNVYIGESGDVFAGGDVSTTSLVRNGFVVKFSPWPVFVSSHSAPGSKVLGLTMSGDGGAYFVSNNAVTKVSSSLAVESSVTYAGAGIPSIWGQKIAGEGGSIFVAGTQSSVIGGESSSDLWLGKINDSLLLEASVSVNAEGMGLLHFDSVAVGPNGDVYISGGSNVMNSGLVARYSPDLVLISSVTGFNSRYGIQMDISDAGYIYFRTLYDWTAIPSTRTVYKYDQDLQFVSSVPFNGCFHMTHMLREVSGNVYLSGQDDSFWFYNTPAYIWKYDSDLVLQSTVPFAGTYGFYDIAADEAGNLYPVGAGYPPGGGQSVGAVTKHASDMTFLSSVTLPSPEGGGSGAPAVVVSTSSQRVFVGGVSGDYGGIWKYDYDLNMVSSVTLSGDSYGNSVVVDLAITPDNNLLATGKSFNKFWLARLTQELVVISSFTVDFQEFDYDIGVSLAVSRDGNIYVAGGSAPSAFDNPATAWLGWFTYADEAGTQQGMAAGVPAFTGVSTGGFSAVWSSTYAANTLYYAQISTTSDFTSVLASSSTYNKSAGFSGLAVNATYYGRVYDPLAGAFVGLGSISTLANPPAAVAFNTVWQSSAAISWSANGNPDWTGYEVALWGAGASTTTLSAVSTTAAVVPLPEGTTVYFGVRALSSSGSASEYAVAISTCIQAAVTAVETGADETVLYNGPSGDITASIPAGAFDQSVSVTIKTPAAWSVPSPTAGLLALNSPVNLEVTLDKPLQPSRNVEIIVSYRDSDLGARDESKLVLARFDEPHAAWVPLPSTRDTVNNRITAVTRHFSLFQVMQVTPSATLTGVTVGPNPLKPSSNPGQSFTFRNLPADGRVKIYSYLGELLYEARADGSGMAVWDGRNKSGARVASGLYLALVQGAGDKKIMKLVIER